MFLDRIKQFSKGICFLIKGISDKEAKFVADNLNKRELELFNSLTIYDKQHSIRVAKSVERIVISQNIVGEHKNILIKSALLHDIGKSKAKFLIIDRVIIVLIISIYGNKICKLNNNKINIYYNHAYIGYEILKDLGLSDKILFLVKNHHEEKLNDSDLNILRFCDNKN